MCSVELPGVLAINNVILPEAGKFLHILLKVYTKHHADTFTCWRSKFHVKNLHDRTSYRHRVIWCESIWMLWLISGSNALGNFFKKLLFCLKMIYFHVLFGMPLFLMVEPEHEIASPSSCSDKSVLRLICASGVTDLLWILSPAANLSFSLQSPQQETSFQ